MYIRTINNTDKISILSKPRTISGNIDKYHEKDIIKHKTINNEMIMLSGITGSGKTSGTAKIANTLHKNKTTIIVVTEKRGAEFSFANCCLPKECLPQFHLDWLERFKVPVQPIDVKIYHPFTFALREKFGKRGQVYKRKQFPIQYFTISLKKLGDYSMNVILKGTEDRTAFDVCSKVLKKLDDEDDIRIFLKKVYDKTKEVGIKQIKINVKENWGFFVGKDTSVNIWKQILNSFSDFQEHYFLQNSLNPYNLDIVKMINDQKRYHIISTKYIRDRKLKYLVMINIVEQIVEAMTYGLAKYRICLIFEEAKDYFPSQDQTNYEAEFSRQTKRLLSTCRDVRGYGATIIANAQDFFKVSPNFSSCMSKCMIGKSSPFDRRKYMKDYGWGIEKIRMLERLEVGEFIIWEDSLNKKYLVHIPPHGISEEGKDFMQMYIKHFPDKLKTAEGVMAYFTKLKKDSDKDMVEMAKEMRKEIIKKRLKKIKEKSSGKEVAEAKGKVKEVRDEQKQAISLREICRRVGIKHPFTIKKRIVEYSKVIGDDEVVERFSK